MNSLCECCVWRNECEMMDIATDTDCDNFDSIDVEYDDVNAEEEYVDDLRMRSLRAAFVAMEQENI